MKQLRVSEKDYNMLQEHLYPGDGKEAIAFALCGRLEMENFVCFTVHKVLLIPHELCKTRRSDLIEWPSTYIEDLLMEAGKKKLSVLKIHSHPNGYEEFSMTDNECDRDLFRSIYGWVDDTFQHLSCVMLPNGKIFGRVIPEDLNFSRIDKIMVVGNKIDIWENAMTGGLSEIDLRNLQAFGERTIQLLKRMKVAVIGCSGTGSVVIEQLVRLGIGELILVDDDRVEHKNLNRILNTIETNATDKQYKVDVLKARLEQVGFGTKFDLVKNNICDSKSDLRKIASADFIFGCTDTVESRHFVNQLSTYYLLPYIDIGVMLRADGNHGISKIIGATHYIQPKGSSLITRGVYTMEDFKSERMRRIDPEGYKNLLDEKYIKGAGEIESPAVISVNMQIAAIAVNEFLNKIDPYKSCDDMDNAIIRMLISDNIFENENDGDPDDYLALSAGLGDRDHFIGLTGI